MLCLVFPIFPLVYGVGEITVWKFLIRICCIAARKYGDVFNAVSGKRPNVAGRASLVMLSCYPSFSFSFCLVSSGIFIVYIIQGKQVLYI